MGGSRLERSLEVLGLWKDWRDSLSYYATTVCCLCLFVVLCHRQVGLGGAGCGTGKQARACLCNRVFLAVVLVLVLTLI